MAKTKTSSTGYRYLLLHACGRAGCTGSIGDIVVLDQANHEWFQKYVVPGHGAKLLVDEETEEAIAEPVAEFR